MVTPAPPGIQHETVVDSLSWQFFVLRWGRWPCPWILRRDGGDKKWQKKVQVEEDSEESDSTGKLGTRLINDDSCFVRIVNHAKCQCIVRLISQGIVKLDHPCIHVDFPIVLCEMWTLADLLWGADAVSPGEVLFQSQVLWSTLDLCSGETKENSNCHIKMRHWMKCYTF